MNSWYSVEGKDSDVAIYTKISLQRNIKGFPFPNRMSSQQRSQVNELVTQALTADEDFNTNFQIIDLDKLPQFSIHALQERGLISPNFSHDPLNKKLILSNDEKVSIMLCGEDHIRATVLVSGMDLETAFNLTEGIDNIICSSLPIAFDDRLGFLTASPMDLGTALRAEVLMHLPSLETDGEIILFDGYEVDLSEVVRDRFLMNISGRYLCSEDCKGLCPVCGHDLNEGDCGCSGETIDPRWQALADILNQQNDE